MAGFNAYVFSEGNRQSGKFAPEQAAIVNDVKKGTIGFPFCVSAGGRIGA
ncbi:hypothetical protein KZ770_12580 [Escherichia coli]|nr:hypothetical protein [Escherichia coli]